MSLLNFALAHSPIATAIKVCMHFDRNKGKKTGLYCDYLYNLDTSYTRKYLNKKYSYIFEKWNNSTTYLRSYIPESNFAWTCWLTGRNDAPGMIRKIFDIQEQHLPEYNYNVITLKNIDDYLDIPSFVYDKFNKGIITPTHFTDIIRSGLLAKYGGLWLDSTVLLNHDIDSSILKYPFYYAKGIDSNFSAFPTCREVTKWEGYFIAGQKDSLFYNYMYDFFCEYWRREQSLVQYLLINNIAILGIEKIHLLSRQDNLVPKNNIQCELLQDAIVQNNYNYVNFLLSSNCSIFKLSRHDQYNNQLIKYVFDLSCSK